MLVAWKIVGHVKPANLIVAIAVSVWLVWLRIVEAGGSHHLDRPIIPHSLPPEWRTAGWAKSA